MLHIHYEKCEDGAYLVFQADYELRQYVRIGTARRDPELRQWVFIPLDIMKSWSFAPSRRNAVYQALRLDELKQIYSQSKSKPDTPSSTQGAELDANGQPISFF